MSSLGSIYGLIAVGYTMVYGIIGMVKLCPRRHLHDLCLRHRYCVGGVLCVWFQFYFFGTAHRSTVGVGDYCAVWLGDRAGGLSSSAWFGALSTDDFGHRHVVGVAELCAKSVKGARSQGVPTLIDGNLTFGSGEDIIQISHTQFFIIIVAIISMAALTLIISKTSLGRACRATQQDIAMASILGVNVDRTIAWVFVIGAAMAAIAGVLVSLNYGTFDFLHRLRHWHQGFHCRGARWYRLAARGNVGWHCAWFMRSTFLWLNQYRLQRCVCFLYSGVSVDFQT